MHTLFYTEQLRIPLIVRVPGLGGGRIDAAVEAIDVMPTIFSLLGIDPPYPFQGRDLAPLMMGDEDGNRERVRFSENRGGIAVLREPWKLIYFRDARQPVELYNLVEDPGELNNLAPQHPEIVADLQERYAELVVASEPLVQLFPHEGGQLTLDEATLEQLRALGYIR